MQGDMIYCEGETTTNLSTGVVNRDYIDVFKHPYTILLSVYAKLNAGDYTGAVVIDSEDTYVYVQTAYVSQQIPDLLNKLKHALFKCHVMLSESINQSILFSEIYIYINN